MESGFSDDGIVQLQIDRHVACRAVRYKHAVFDRSVLCIRQGPRDILGQIGSASGRAYADRANINGRTGGHKIVLGRQNSMVKHIGRCRSRSDDEAGRDGTLGAVGGTVDYADGVGTLRACGVGGGAAAVEVYRRYAACLEHDLRELVHGAATGEGLLTTVENHHDNLAVGGNAHAGAGVAFGVI